MAGTTPRVINSLQRAFDILDLFDEQTAELGITEIAETLGLHKSTAAGLVYTLEYNGYLGQDPESRKYSLGFKLVERASVLLDQIVYIERLTTTQSLGMRAKVGYRAPMQCTALGKAILSGMPQEEAQKLVAQLGLLAVTAHSITDLTQFLGGHSLKLG
jgi:IclR family KDG regulon transcriptional repressor